MFEQVIPIHFPSTYHTIETTRSSSGRGYYTALYATEWDPDRRRLWACWKDKIMFLSPQQMRWCGWLLFIGALLSIFVVLVEFTISLPLLLTASFSLLGGLLVLIGLPGTYVKQRDLIGILGTIGFFILWLTWLVTTLGVNVEEIVIAITAAHPTAQSVPAVLVNILNLTDLIMLIGALLYGVQTIRARLFPASVGWLLISTVVAMTLALFIGGVLAQLLYIIGELLMQSGFARLGYALARWHDDDSELEPVESGQVVTMSDLQQ